MVRQTKVSVRKAYCFLLIIGLLFADQEPAYSATPDLLRLGSVDRVVENSHILKPGDEIELKVYREDDLSTKTKLDKDGTIALPLIGEVRLGGLTVKKARDLVRVLYEKDYLVNPQIVLTYTRSETAGSFTVLGRVNSPGSFPMPKGKERIGLLEALAMSGGMTRYANPASIKVKRHENGGEKVYEVNSKKLADDPDTPPFYILPGDSINVPERRF